MISSTIAMAQNLTFDSAVMSLYFGVSIFNASSAIVDSLEKIDHLSSNDTIIGQWGVNNIIAGNQERQFSHRFSFTKSPINGLKIKSGEIIVRLAQAGKVKKLITADWHVTFDNQVDGEAYYHKLIEIFSPLSTMQKTEFNDFIGHIAQYSTRNENEKGIRDITIMFGKSPMTNEPQIILSLSNEFKFNDNNNFE